MQESAQIMHIYWMEVISLKWKLHPDYMRFLNVDPMKCQNASKLNHGS